MRNSTERRFGTKQGWSLMWCWAVLFTFTYFSQIGWSAPSKSSSSRTSIEKYREGEDLRKSRRAGVGFSLMGPAGLAGVQMELNFVSNFGFQIGVGQGGEFQSFTVQVRRYTHGESFWPYLGLGYSRWYTIGNPRGPLTKTSPEILGEKFLSESALKEGVFSEDLLFPSIGIQYVKMSGRWAGIAAFAEIIILMDLGDLVVAPTGTLGFFYYF